MTKFAGVVDEIRRCWQGLRAVTGDDAYERYLAHWREHHGREGAIPKDRETFFRERIERKWSGIKRCC